MGMVLTDINVACDLSFHWVFTMEISKIRFIATMVQGGLYFTFFCQSLWDL